jgi:hypothetical protein
VPGTKHVSLKDYIYFWGRKYEKGAIIPVVARLCSPKIHTLKT